ncbi:hypothetical protein [Methylobacterium sp.]|uniref:hypothetical protein n=1 Tax=Methylobacterium sp. TaxID=409 RepID=UPI0025EA6119|nr:hypothetical protein [Methylobacterium sp.]
MAALAWAASRPRTPYPDRLTVPPEDCPLPADPDAMALPTLWGRIGPGALEADPAIPVPDIVFDTAPAADVGRFRPPLPEPKPLADAPPPPPGERAFSSS